MAAVVPTKINPEYRRLRAVTRHLDTSAVSSLPAPRHGAVSLRRGHHNYKRTRGEEAPPSAGVVVVRAGPYTFEGVLEEAKAPLTCELFRSLLPHAGKMIQARWSGFAAWVPSPLGPAAAVPVLPAENATMVPLPGQLLFYPGGISEVEILLPYGPTVFASVAGQLAGNHFLTLTKGTEHFAALGELVQWQGAQEIVFERGEGGLDLGRR